jgi:hypothetical protein
MKAPSTNTQVPEKLQEPSFRTSDLRLGLELEVWSFSGGWRLELGA